MLDAQVNLDLGARVVAHLQAKSIEQRDLDRIVRVSLARELHRSGLLSLGLAAELAGMERHELMAELARDRAPLVVLPEGELQREFDLLDSLLGKKGDA